jgi:hypothetical protein
MESTDYVKFFKSAEMVPRHSYRKLSTGLANAAFSEM